MPTTRQNPAAIATPRGDANSMRAHEQLVAKARQGGIDLYFLGDSITRRWGCTDPQWADLHANWKKHFFGWNAGNFGWGADRIENILWRVEHGELDGVNPKVIVILAGTNNISAHPSDEEARDIVEGLRALLAACHARAPDAKIILTGILPRDDKPGLMPEIRQINQSLKTFADDRTVYFVDVSDGLMSGDQLIEGVTIDGLHLSAKGYDVWAEGLRPLLMRFLGPPAETDHAPPATGDPSLGMH